MVVVVVVESGTTRIGLRRVARMIQAGEEEAAELDRRRLRVRTNRGQAEQMNISMVEEGGEGLRRRHLEAGGGLVFLVGLGPIDEGGRAVETPRGMTDAAIWCASLLLLFLPWSMALIPGTSCSVRYMRASS